MELSAAIAGIAVALALGAMSPGPSFLMVARTALSISRRDGLAVAAGMGCGAVVFAITSLLGLQSLLASVPSLYIALKVLGGGYLLYLGYQIWRNSHEPLMSVDATPQDQAPQAWRSFCLGLTTQLSNPKTAVVYASVFASLLPRETPQWVPFVLPVMVFVVETSWYSLVAVALSSPLPRARYLAAQALLDYLAGGVMVGLGAKLIWDDKQL